MARATNYIHEIDSLRAIAVLSVIVFHLNSGALPGGFVGVDIFYVISGFVVALSVRSLKAENFKEYLTEFYRRRFIRIYPVLLSFLLVGFVFWALFIPEGYAGSDTFMTGLLSVFGLSNVGLFLKTGEYFGTLAEYNIFTHTWSLGIEEQYYFVFPVISYFIIFRPRYSLSWNKVALISACSLLILSIALAAVLSYTAPVFAFYMIPTRFWELGLGFFAARSLMNAEVSTIGKPVPCIPDWAIVLCLLVLGFSFVYIPQEGFPFPGAVAPCLATTGLLISAYQRRSALLRLLSHPVTMWIGKLSFSLYLWHWLVIVFMRWTVGIDTFQLQVVALCVMFLLSIISYYAVEVPARYSVRVSRLSNSRFYVVFCITILVAILTFTALKFAKPYVSFSASANQDIWSGYSAASTKNARCGLDEENRRALGGRVITLNPTNCTLSEGLIFVMGDSHAGAYLRALRSIAAFEGYKIQIFTRGGCKFLPGVQLANLSDCGEFVRYATSEVLKVAGSKDVLFLPAMYVNRYRDYWDGAVLQTSELDVSPKPEDLHQAEVDSGVLTQFAARGAKILLEAPKPILTSANFRCADWLTRTNTYCSVLPATKDDEEIRRLRTVRYLEKIAEQSPSIEIFDPFPILCPGNICSGWVEDRPVINDADHLSGFGNDLLRPYLLGYFQRLTGQNSHISSN